MNTGCRISKVRMKNGGAEISLIKHEPRTHFHTTIEHAANCIGDDTHAIGFFVLYKDGTTSNGISYDSGFTISQLHGACERMKEELLGVVWGD